MKHVLRPALALAAAAALSTGLLAGSASAASAAATSTAASSGGTYLALGDSVPFGYSPLIPVPSDPSSYVGYPELAAPVLHLGLTNLACPGETTGSFLDTSAPDNGCQDFRAAASLHTSYTGSQADAAVAYLESHPQTRLVTLMIGANDLFLCEQSTSDGCTATAELGATLAQVGAHLQQILDTIRAHYTGRLELVTYYSTDYTDPTITGAIGALDDVVTAQAAAHSAQVADALTAFGKIAALAGGKTCNADLLIKLPAGGCDIHPSRLGAGVLAATVVVAGHQRAA